MIKIKDIKNDKDFCKSLANLTNINSESKLDNGLNLLYYLSYLGYVDSVNLLLEKSNNLIFKDKRGLTALHAAAEKGDEMGIIIDLLVKYGFKKNSQSKAGENPYDIAFFYKRNPIILEKLSIK